MQQPVRSLMISGSNGVVVDVECRISRGLPALLIVGFGNRAVNEAKERVRAAFAASHLKLPPQRITINLAPADVPKDGTGFDAAVAVSILAAIHGSHTLAPGSLVFGELGLDGTLRPVRGLVGALLAACKQGYKTFYIPARQLRQAALIPGITLMPIQNLSELSRALTGSHAIRQHTTGSGTSPPIAIDVEPAAGFSQVVGQLHAKRALEIAAAGGHNILLSGPPGSGKSMLAKALASILPPLSREEILEVTHLHSLTTGYYDSLVTTRPFRAPHHSASLLSMIGGGQQLRPGEITLAHRGILFLDELPEFTRATLEALRQPLEDKTITLTRARENLCFPADFILVATANPCPCGYYGTDKICRCPPYAVQRYRHKLSGPLLDRIDLYVEVGAIEHTQLLAPTNIEASTHIRQRVEKARKHQLSRKPFGKLNTLLANQDIQSHLNLSSDAKELLNTAAAQLQLSARAYMRSIKVARTIADLAGSAGINTDHMSEALQYRLHENP